MIRRAGQTTETRSRIPTRCLPPSPLPPVKSASRLASSRSRIRAALGAKNVAVRNSLYVGNLGSLDGRELEQLLARFGTVRCAAMIGGGAGGGGAPRDGRFGVVEMQSEDEARTAIRVLDGFEINGRPISVRWATPEEQTACGHPAMFGTMNLSGGPRGD